MIEFLRGFFDGISNFFTKIWEILTWLFEEITQLFKLFLPVMNFIRKLLGSLPPVFLVFGLAMIAILILYVVLGRQAGGD